jgi:hypothetical protein
VSVVGLCLHQAFKFPQCLVVIHISSHLSYARFSESSSNHRTDLNVWGHHGGCPQ